MKILPGLNSTDQGSFVEFSADCSNTNPLAVAVILVGKCEIWRRQEENQPSQPPALNGTMVAVGT
jgi:hypothetical protein